MKKMIDNSGGYKTFFELRPFTNPSHKGWKSLIVTTLWEGARGEIYEQKQYEINLDPAGLDSLREFLNEM